MHAVTMFQTNSDEFNRELSKIKFLINFYNIVLTFFLDFLDLFQNPFFKVTWLTLITVITVLFFVAQRWILRESQSFEANIIEHNFIHLLQARAEPLEPFDYRWETPT